MAATWLGISYTVPAKPSKARVYIWRKLKELGAEYYHGMAMLPGGEENLRRVQALSDKIRELGVEVTLLEIHFLSAADEEKVIAQFKHQAESDFRELLLDFAQLYEDLGAPLNADEERSRSMRRRYSKLRSRDFFNVEKELDLQGGFAELLGDIQLSATDLSRQFFKIFGEKQS